MLFERAPDTTTVSWKHGVHGMIRNPSVRWPNLNHQEPRWFFLANLPYPMFVAKKTGTPGCRFWIWGTTADARLSAMSCWWMRWPLVATPLWRRRACLPRQRGAPVLRCCAASASWQAPWQARACPQFCDTDWNQKIAFPVGKDVFWSIFCKCSMGFDVLFVKTLRISQRCHSHETAETIGTADCPSIC